MLCNQRSRISSVTSSGYAVVFRHGTDERRGELRSQYAKEQPYWRASWLRVLHLLLVRYKNVFV